VTTVMRLIGIENEMFLRLLTRAPRTSMASWVMAGSTKEPIVKNLRPLATDHLSAKHRQCEVGKSDGYKFNSKSGDSISLGTRAPSPAMTAKREHDCFIGAD